MDDASKLRTFLALIAASVGVLICLYQRHFTLERTAHSFAVMFTHRCGLAMVAAVCWMLAEVANFLWNGIRQPDQRLEQQAN